ncbi:DUF2530 domain-containing protein [Cellulomonas composti]|uniref:DUF2530 domain-containing protein n=1 Tax=Cellulomonas composti TaxID=266130 RepID=A0A511JCW7_9CELL|nr:DUF2530 domain-containing protein [Cellulomonas composti]GEL95848.1 hypothetical protein CCO02nite_25060 [Cellulomonas composti]
MPSPTHAPPPPVAVDLARVVQVGLALWAIGLVVTVGLALTDVTDWVPAATCGAGIAIGFAALAWTRRH